MLRRSFRQLAQDQPASPQQGYQARHKAMGLCIVCPRPLTEGSTIYCEWHRQKSRERKQRLRGSLLCPKCHKPVSEADRHPKRRYHLQCLRAVLVERARRYRKLHAAAARAYQQRHVAMGLCTQCPRPVVPGKRVCSVHLRYRQERYRLLKA